MPPKRKASSDNVPPATKRGRMGATSTRSQQPLPGVSNEASTSAASQPAAVSPAIPDSLIATIVQRVTEQGGLNSRVGSRRVCGGNDG